MSKPDFIPREPKPIDQIVGPLTYAAMQQISAARACVIARQMSAINRGQFRGTRLTESRPMSGEQLQRFQERLLAPESYWTGRPIYKRLPPRPDFLIEMEAASTAWLIAIDLTNPGWQIDCQGEFYSAFHFAGAALRTLAKQLFPEFASPRKQAMWAKGAFCWSGGSPGRTGEVK